MQKEQSSSELVHQVNQFLKTEIEEEMAKIFKLRRDEVVAQLELAQNLKALLQNEETGDAKATEEIKKAVIPPISEHDQERINDDRWTFQGDSDHFVKQYINHPMQFFQKLDQRIKELEWAVEMAEYKLLYDHKAASAKNETLQTMVSNCISTKYEDVLDNKAFRNCYLFPFGQSSFYKLEFSRKQSTVQTISHQDFSCKSPDYQAIQVGNDFFKVTSSNLEVTEFQQAKDANPSEVKESGWSAVRKRQAKGDSRWKFSLTFIELAVEPATPATPSKPHRKGPQEFDQHLIVSGGYHHHTTIDIFVYDIKKDSWSRKGAMHVPRSNHASCSLGTKVYFFGGIDSNQNRLSSIEWIDMIDTSEKRRPTKEWIDKFTPAIVMPREFPAFAPISDTKIGIMGGINAEGKIGTRSNDCFLSFDTADECNLEGQADKEPKFEEVKVDIDEDVHFCCKGFSIKDQQSTMVSSQRSNPIFSLVKTSEHGKCIVRWDGQSNFTIIKGDL